MQPNGSDPLWRLEKALAEGAARDPVQPDRATESGPPTEAGRPEFSTLLGDLSGAIAVVTVAHGSLEAKEIGEVGDEEVALRYAISLLHRAYTALDMASLHSS